MIRSTVVTQQTDRCVHLSAAVPSLGTRDTVINSGIRRRYATSPDERPVFSMSQIIDLLKSDGPTEDGVIEIGVMDTEDVCSNAIYLITGFLAILLPI